MVSAWHPPGDGDRHHWSALVLTEMVAALVLFLAAIGGLWIILSTLS